MKRNVLGGGFTLAELLAVVIVVVVFAAVFIVPNAGRRTGCGNRQSRDSTQVRGLHHGLVTWAQSNKDQYPLPSAVDVNNVTVADIGGAKDHTANILSMLVYNGTISTELLISPAEASGTIRLKDDYEFETPKAAVDPAKALWDPSLSADFTRVGNISYAHMLPSGPRLSAWGNSGGATAGVGVLSEGRAVLGNRGPEIASVKQNPDGTAIPTVANPKSTTLMIHGSRSKWEGNVAFEDNHVEFMTSLKGGTYLDAKGVKREDILFYDEPDDAAGMNNFLGIFTKAGGTPGQFRAIWD
jgi:type II secretory pathway pseudopilin PulG